MKHLTIIILLFFAFHAGVQAQKGSARTPAVAYITQAGFNYYQLQGKANVGPMATQLNISWDAKGMQYTSTQGVTGIFTKLGTTKPFLNGTLHFFKFDHNPDPGTSPQAVNRVAVIGVKANGSFGFLREIDFVGGAIPRNLSFETMVAPNGANSFVVLEAGSTSALQ